ncbi:MAG TPA: DUF134 domain-containing protein [Prolixibacteraceae bacterium]|nr:DUF134 domain-containing protein [Prolixibacteraceae bacterium]
MSRNSKSRRINAPPRFGGYKPWGCPPGTGEPVYLLYEEYEALKLADYKLMNHFEAAVLMGISRPTFARIYENARRKIALALVETREIVTINGNSYTEKVWYSCKKCHTRFTQPSSLEKKTCPLCRSESVNGILPEPLQNPQYQKNIKINK